MIVCKEMQKLRDILAEKDIDWIDASEELHHDFIDWWICRTHFNYGKYHVSVINGRGIYGGFSCDERYNEGLLEMMTSAVNKGDPVGHLTADEAMKLLEKGEQE